MSVTMSAANAMKLFDLVAEASDAAGGGKYRGFNLVAELQARGIELSLGDAPPQKPVVEPNGVAETSSAIGHG